MYKEYEVNATMIPLLCEGRNAKVIYKILLRTVYEMKNMQIH